MADLREREREREREQQQQQQQTRLFKIFFLFFGKIKSIFKARVPVVWPILNYSIKDVSNNFFLLTNTQLKINKINQQ